MRVSLSLEAQADIAAIRSYTEARNPRAAARLVLRLLDLCEDLQTFPQRGRPGRRPDLRELASVWPYVIVYRVGVDHVEIVRIQHSRQQR